MHAVFLWVERLLVFCCVSETPSIYTFILKWMIRCNKFEKEWRTLNWFRSLKTTKASQQMISRQTVKSDCEVSFSGQKYKFFSGETISAIYLCCFPNCSESDSSTSKNDDWAAKPISRDIGRIYFAIQKANLFNLCCTWDQQLCIDNLLLQINDTHSNIQALSGPWNHKHPVTNPSRCIFAATTSVSFGNLSACKQTSCAGMHIS